jgi:hypothetical protein
LPELAAMGRRNFQAPQTVEARKDGKLKVILIFQLQRKSICPHGKKKFSSLEHCTPFMECLTIAKAIAIHIS